MQEINLNDTVSIVSFGHICQSRLSDLNKCVSNQAAGEDYNEAAGIISELNEFSKKLSAKTHNENKIYLDGLRDRIIKCHRKWVMQEKTYGQLLKAQNAYIEDLEKHIEYAGSFKTRGNSVANNAGAVLKKRIEELDITHAIAVNFASHIELCRKNAELMASKLQSTVMTVLPLLSADMMFESNAASVNAAKKIIEKATGDFGDYLGRR